MKRPHVHPLEMLRSHPLHDTEIEDVLSGLVPEDHPDLAEVAAFVVDVRTSVQAAPPQLGPSLAAMLATGLIPTENGDLPATAASNANGPEIQAAGLPKWRKIPVISALFESTVARVAGAVLTVIAGAGGLGVAGALPGPLQGGFADIAETVGFHAPGSDDDQATAPEPEDEAEDAEDADEAAEAADEAAEAEADWYEAVAEAGRARAEAAWYQAVAQGSSDQSDDVEGDDLAEEDDVDGLEEETDDVDEPDVDDPAEELDETEIDEPDDEPDHEDESDDQAEELGDDADDVDED